jgi:hypothetical protein
MTPIRFGRNPNPEAEPIKPIHQEQYAAATPLRPELKKWRQMWVYSNGDELHRILEALKKEGIPVKTWRDVAKLM